MIPLLIIITAVAWGLYWLALGIADYRHTHRPLPPVTQPPPRPQPSWVPLDIARARTTRGRHARPGGLQ